jgi:hypothetical protein
MKNYISIVAIVAVFAVLAMVLVTEKPALSGQATNSFCSETDGGINLHVNGRIRTNNQELDFDRCLDSTTLVEKYCTNKGIQSKTVNCVAEGYRICNQGACFR